MFYLLHSSCKCILVKYFASSLTVYSCKISIRITTSYLKVVWIKENVNQFILSFFSIPKIDVPPSNTATLSSNSSFTAFETKHCFTFLPASDIEHILHFLFWWAMPTMHGVEISVLLHCERLWNIWAESFCILQIPSYPYRTWWDTHNCMSSKIKVREGWAFKKRALKGMYLVDTKTQSCFVSSLILLRSIF